MQTFRRWDEGARAYQPYHVPDGWKLLCYSADMEEPCNCALCGREMTYGEGYTSLQVHTPTGFGYTVCRDCHFDVELPARFRPHGAF